MVKPIAQAFLAQIKGEFETNELLKGVYPDVLYRNPRTLGPDGRPAKWSLERGLTVKRKGNPKEATIEAHGLIDGQPTSRHFQLHIYDDVVTQDYLSEESIRKTTERWELADNAHVPLRPATSARAIAIRTVRIDSQKAAALQSSRSNRQAYESWLLCVPSSRDRSAGKMFWNA